METWKVVGGIAGVIYLVGAVTIWLSASRDIKENPLMGGWIAIGALYSSLLWPLLLIAVPLVALSNLIWPAPTVDEILGRQTREGTLSRLRTAAFKIRAKISRWIPCSGRTLGRPKKKRG